MRRTSFAKAASRNQLAKAEVFSGAYGLPMPWPTGWRATLLSSHPPYLGVKKIRCDRRHIPLRMGTAPAICNKASATFPHQIRAVKSSRFFYMRSDVTEKAPRSAYAEWSSAQRICSFLLLLPRCPMPFPPHRVCLSASPPHAGRNNAGSAARWCEPRGKH